MDATAHDLLSRFVEYPRQGFPADVQADLARIDLPEAAAAELRAFLQMVDSLPLTACQELYTRTFDLNPTCSLEVGWHRYGEAYERGTFLVTMRGLMRDTGVEEGTELPDHLSHVLRVLGRLDPSQALGRAHHQVLPALEAMNGKLASGDNPYRHVLFAILEFVKWAHAAPEGASTHV